MDKTGVWNRKCLGVCRHEYLNRLVRTGLTEDIERRK